jgi:pimeloyl-ACP methyl ester carboxylesterase
MVQQAVSTHREELLAQCPAPGVRVAESEEARFPIHIDRFGYSGPQVLLIHGGVQGRIGGGPKDFERQAALAKMGWSVESVSRPGFGASPSRGPDDMYADARALSKLIKPGAHVIGHSWGGTEALLAVARQPQRVRSLILIEPAIAPMIGGPEVLADPTVLEDLKTKTLAQLATRTPADFARVFASQMGQVGSDNPIGADFAKISDPDAMQLGCTGLVAKMASDDDILAAINTLKQAHIPVLIVTGGWSPSFDATGEVLARLLDGKHVVVPSPNHFVQYTSAEAFNAVAADFIRSAGPRTRGEP